MASTPSTTTTSTVPVDTVALAVIDFDMKSFGVDIQVRHGNLALLLHPDANEIYQHRVQLDTFTADQMQLFITQVLTAEQRDKLLADLAARRERQAEAKRAAEVRRKQDPFFNTHSCPYYPCPHR